MKTWNPITGCLHNCLYCWARSYARRLAAMDVEPYKTHGFSPTFAEWRLKQRLPKDEVIFVSDMGDMWGEWVPGEWIEKVLKVLRSNLGTECLFLTKNPRRYHEFHGSFAESMTLGATIETNRSYKVTRAPTPRERFEEMKSLDWKHKAIVVEPVLDFDLEFIDWIKEIRPEIVYIGYDNYNYRLPEPQLRKVEMLAEELRGIAEVQAKNMRRAWFE